MIFSTQFSLYNRPRVPGLLSINSSFTTGISFPDGSLVFTVLPASIQSILIGVGAPVLISTLIVDLSGKFGTIYGLLIE